MFENLEPEIARRPKPAPAIHGDLLKPDFGFSSATVVPKDISFGALGWRVAVMNDRSADIESLVPGVVETANQFRLAAPQMEVSSSASPKILVKPQLAIEDGFAQDHTGSPRAMTDPGHNLLAIAQVEARASQPQHRLRPARQPRGWSSFPQRQDSPGENPDVRMPLNGVPKVAEPFLVEIHVIVREE
jgi:hypothetical protein